MGVKMGMKCEGCTIQCNGKDDKLACETMSTCNGCPICKEGRKLTMVTCVDYDRKFLFVRCNCGQSGYPVLQADEIATEDDYKKAAAYWNEKGQPAK